MSRIAPDIPELSHLPELVRPVVWTRAMMRSVSAPATLGLALAVAIVLFFGGVLAGARTGGWLGVLVGGGLGVVAAIYLYLRVLVPWQARRLLPLVLKEQDWTAAFGDAVRAQDRIKAVIARGQHSSNS